MAQRPDPGRDALEALAIEGYRSGALARYQASQLHHMSRYEFGFPKARHIDGHARHVEAFERDRATLERRKAA